MLWLAHTGIGLKLAQPFSRGLPVRVVALGTLLPDLIDKPLYYALVALNGGNHVALEGALISGTRTFGHTALLTLAIGAAGLVRQNRVLAALALGMGTHHLLDAFFTAAPEALFWPALGVRFPVYPFSNTHAHLWSYLSAPWLLAEALGALLLVDELWFKHRRRRRSF